MLTKVEKSELSRRERSPLRAFADEAAREFLEVSHAGDVYEVTGAPEEGAARLAEALRGALHYLDGGARREVRVMTRGGSRVFMERLETAAKPTGGAPWRWPEQGGRNRKD